MTNMTNNKLIKQTNQFFWNYLKFHEKVGKQFPNRGIVIPLVTKNHKKCDQGQVVALVSCGILFNCGRGYAKSVQPDDVGCS